MNGFLEELKRRNVFRVAVAYAVLAWVVIQAADILFPALQFPDWTVSFITVLMLMGFPVACLFAWAFELTPDGLKPSHDVVAEQSVTRVTGRTLERATVGLLLVAVMFLVWDGYLRQADEPVADAGVPATTSIAVLPFVNMSVDPDQTYFSDGISEEILNALAKIPELHVTSRSSAFAFKGTKIDIPTVAAHLGVANILEGSVRKSGNKIRITAQLIDTKTDRHLWSETYDRELTDIFVIQDEIAGAIVLALRGKLGISLGSPAPSNAAASVKAYDFYLRGLELLNGDFGTDPTHRAVAYFQQSIVLDPAFAPAHAGLCRANMSLYVDSKTPDFLSVAEAACDKAQTFDGERNEVKLAVSALYRSHGDLDAALAIVEGVVAADPGSYEAHTQLGHILEALNKVPEARRAYGRAIDLRPASWRAYDRYGGFLYYQGLYQQSLDWHRKALRLSPDNPKVLNNIGAGEYSLGNFGAAGAAWRRSLLYNKSASTYANTGAMHYFEGSFDDAADMYRAATLLQPDDYWHWEGLHAALRFLGGHDEETREALAKAISTADVSLSINAGGADALVALGVLHIRSGDLDVGQAYLDRALESDPLDAQTLYFVALGAADAGQHDKALAFIVRALEQGFPKHMMDAEPVLVRVRELDGYKTL